MYSSYIVKRTQIYLDASQDARLAKRAAASGVTKSLLIREALETYLSSPDADANLAAFRAALDDAERSPARFTDGVSYVEELRSADVDRQQDIEDRRR